MQNLLNQEQMRLADAFTIKDKRITSIELMEDAATAFAREFLRQFSDKEATIAILCGKGNNGADGLAIARILKDYGYAHLSVYLLDFSARETEDYTTNLNRLKEMWFPLKTVKSVGDLKKAEEGIIIDAVLGSGLNKPLSGIYLEIAAYINSLKRIVVAVDVPTGFPAEGVLDETYSAIKADLVICFQRPKINFFFPESVRSLKRFITVPIGLDEDFIERLNSPYKLLGAGDIKDLVKPRESFSHKGTYGHALLIAGQQKTMGAALLAARACLSGGAGLTTVSIPESGLTALNTSLPEVMYLDRAELNFTKEESEKFKAIAIGPGLGTGPESQKILEELLKLGVPLIVDADALHLLGDHESLIKQLPEGSILTPHMKEFDHLFGAHDSWWERVESARSWAVRLNCVIVLKNQYTFIVDQQGNVKINPTGNPAMGQGGMGDVLTGLIASFFAQGYLADQAAYLSCYLHGQSGDDLAENRVSVTASAVAEHVSEVLKRLIK